MQAACQSEPYCPQHECQHWFTADAEICKFLKIDAHYRALTVQKKTIIYTSIGLKLLYLIPFWLITKLLVALLGYLLIIRSTRPL